MNKKYIPVVLILIIFILSGLYWKQCKRVSDQKDQVVKYELAIEALNDTIKKKFNGKDTVFVEKTVSFDLEDIMNSAAYKSLSKDKQKFYKDLLGTKGLLASAEIQLSSKDSIIQYLEYKLNTKVTDSLVCFKKNDSLDFGDVKGTNLKYNEKLFFGDKLKRIFTYEYNVKINSTYRKEKDGSIVIEHKLDDPKASIIDGQSFMVPMDKPETKFKKFMRKTGNYILMGVAFAGGIYIAKL
jgi:hypothetical protein